MKKKLHLRIQALVLVLLLALGTFVIAPEQVLADTKVAANEETPQVAADEEVVETSEAEQVAEEVVADNPDDQNDDLMVPNNAERSRGIREYTPEGDFLFAEETQTITGYIGTSKNVNIPPTINEFDVKHIGDEVFTFKDLESVTIPNGVETIGDKAFHNNLLMEIVIPGSVTEIGENAFSNNKFTSVIIPGSVTSLGHAAFSSNELLTSVTILNGVSMIGTEAFSSNQLKRIVIPDSVVSIGENAFGSNPIILATIPDGIGSIVLNEGDPITNPTIEEIGQYCFDPEVYLNTFYIKAYFYIYAAPNGDVITNLWRPLYVTGTNIAGDNADWLEFTYNGNPAYVAKGTTTSTPPEITGYATGLLNLRDEPGGSIIGTIPMGYQVNGELVKNMVKTTYKGKTGYVFASLLQELPVLTTRYIKAGSNIRNASDGTIIETLKMPIYVLGNITESYLYFHYNGDDAYVAIDSTTTTSPPITGYAKQTLNIRDVPGGSIIGTIPIGRKVSGNLYENMVKTTYNGKTGYVYASLLQADPVEVTRYIKANSIIRSTPNGSIITRPWRPIRVTGTIQGAWLKFIYNGKTAYVAMVATTSSNPPMTGYAKQTLNIRDVPGGSIIGTIPIGRKVSGNLVENMVKTTYNGKTGYVYASLLQKNPVKVTRYLVANSIIRSRPDGSIITRPWRPIRVTGTIQGAWLKFTYNKKTAYVAMVSTRTKNPPMTGYAKQTLNLRNTPKGSIIGKIPRGHKVSGVLVGNMVKTTYNGKTGYVYASLLQKNPVKVTRYIKANSIIRSTPNGSIITRPWRPIRVTGTIQGAWLKFTYNGKTAYVAMSATTTSNPPMTGYAKQRLNVRNTPSGSIIGTIPRGHKVSGVLVGNMVKTTYNGKTGYVYASLLEKNPVR